MATQKLNEICENARNNGMIEDPRTAFSNEASTTCGFTYKNKTMKKLGLPKVCGNCGNYSVQS